MKRLLPGFLDRGRRVGRNCMGAVHRRVEQGSNHHNQRGNDSNGFNARTSNHLILDAESQAGCTGMSKNQETLEAPSGLEPEPQV